jgi:hypothetical protein
MKTHRLFHLTVLLFLIAAHSHAAEKTNIVKNLAPAYPPPGGLSFINTAFENASPIHWETDSNGIVQVYLVYDVERSSPNRAAGHWHFQLQGEPGTAFTLVINNLDNVWNGNRSSSANERTIAVISTDQKIWKPIQGKLLPGSRVQFSIEMTGPSLYVARLEPYRLSDLERFLARIQKEPQVEVSKIGKTVEGRDLEMIRVGDKAAPHSVLLRARAHPWEPGGNWIVEGLVDRLLTNDLEAKAFLKRYCVYIMPMANKDGVARGRTRFNVQGKDLNRNWDKPADPTLAPENTALEKWLETMKQRGKLPQLAFELHNDDSGLLHISRPPVANLDEYLARMKTLETLLRAHTWFTEGPTSGTFRNSGTLSEGLLMRYGIDAVVHEFNANWIKGVNDYPSAAHWRDYGAGMAKVFYEYFGKTP